MRLTETPIEPIHKERTISLEPSRAFELFTDRIGEWWPMSTHSIAGDPAAEVRFEGGVGGRVVETSPDGSECAWAEVLAWDPPERFVLAWHPRPRPEAASTVEVRFQPIPGGRTRVVLHHRGWEEFGIEAGTELRDTYGPGWDTVLERLQAHLTARS